MSVLQLHRCKWIRICHGPATNINPELLCEEVYLDNTTFVIERCTKCFKKRAYLTDGEVKQELCLEDSVTIMLKLLQDKSLKFTR
jgi:hypothetical protein